MDEKIKWRFKGNNYVTATGLDTADMETFKKDCIASLARESCQNSIDAKIPDKEKVVIEFHSFKMKKEQIPGKMRLTSEIDSCREYKRKTRNRKEEEQLTKMYREIEKDEIDCLRISDFNTKGLIGVSSNEEKPFYLLTKGSGLTDKVGTSGGSKGIGKYASFVASKFNTVFYSTLNIENEVGYIGISKLCSTTMPDTEEKTQGIGYYGADEKNSPILEQLLMDQEFIRKTPGTDIYILGFKKEEKWVQEIISKILESFMVAIAFGQLEIKVDSYTINKENLKEIVENDDLILSNLRQSIRSQYILLEEKDGVQTKKIEIEDYGSAKLYVKGFHKDESYLATNDCVMIRYPYMKIKSIKNISSIPCSALCIIEDDALNEVLRSIENPQHTDWEYKRIEDDGFRKEIRNIVQQLRKQIQDFIYEVLSSSQSVEVDLEGASQYLPQNEENEMGETSQSKEMIKSEKPIIIKAIRNKIKSNIGIEEDEEANALQPDIGRHIEGEGSPVPEGQNGSSSGNLHDSDTEKGISENGNEEIMRIKPLTGLRYRLFITDKKNGKFILSFESFYEEENCELEMFYLDDSNTKYKVNILSCLVNGRKVKIEEGKAIEILLHKEKTRVELTTDLKELYACEVKMYANKK